MTFFARVGLSTIYIARASHANRQSGQCGESVLAAIMSISAFSTGLTLVLAFTIGACLILPGWFRLVRTGGGGLESSIVVKHNQVRITDILLWYLRKKNKT